MNLTDTEGGRSAGRVTALPSLPHEVVCSELCLLFE